MNSELKKRSHAFDLLCGLCILRMVTLHAICQTQLRQTPWWKETMVWTFFFMSFFFFKAGYFNKGITGKTIPYLKDRIRRLFVPYLSWGIIGGVMACCWFCLYPEGPSKAIGMLAKFRWHVGGLTFGNGPLWFLLSFFVTYILMHFIERVRHLHWVVLLFPFVGYWLFQHGNPLWFYLSNVFCGTFFFYMGKVWRHTLDRLTKQWALAISLVLFVGFVFANIYLHGEYEMRPNLWIGPFWNVLLIMPLSLLGISGILLSMPTPRVPLVNYIGEHSMVFFVMHYPVIMSYVHICRLLGHSLNKSIPDLIFILLITFAICTLAVPFVESVSWLSGKPPFNSSLKREAGRGSVYFYHTQDTERIVREWKQGLFSSHFLYGALQLSDYGFDVVWHHQRHTYKRLHDTIVATWKVLTCRKPYDILYATHTYGIEPIVLLRAIGLFRHPIVAWHHQPIVKAKNPLREALARLFYRGMDHMIFFSGKLIQDSLLSKKADPRRMSMVHWGADLDYYDSLQTLSQPLPCRERSDYFFSRRTICPSPYKGEAGRGSVGLGGSFISTGKELRDYKTLLKAFHETGLPLTLYVQKIRQAYFESLHPKENIELHYGDRLIPHEIAQLVAQSRCVCICCQESNYTVGLTTVVEALALGLPILCTRNPQMPMDIEAEGCGFWLEPKDVEGWKQKLRYIAEHPEEAKAMGKRGRTLAEKYYNVKQCGKEVAEIIKNCKL